VKARTGDCRNCIFLKSMVAGRMAAGSIDEICSRLRLRRVPRGKLLHREGDEATQLYALRSGRVKLFKFDEAGREHVTAVLESGDLFGFEAIFGASYAGAAATLTASEVCVASAADIAALLGTTPRLTLDFTRYLWERMARMYERQVRVSGPGARAKVAGFLLHHLPRGGHGPADVTHDLSLRELGASLGLAPETVCRALSGLRAEGVIERRPRGVRVRDVARLRRYARAE